MRLAVPLAAVVVMALAAAVGWTAVADRAEARQAVADSLAAAAHADSLRAAAEAATARTDSLLAPYAGFEAPSGLSEADARAWAEAMLATMTLDERAAQLFVVELGAVRDPDGLARMGIGGFHVNRRTPPQEVRTVTTRLTSRAEVPPFFTADYEWGVGRASTNFTELPAAMAYGAADDEALAFVGGAITALEARAMGITVLFAPVADVNNNPANPIINTRSFGEDPERVGELAAAYVRGAQANGVLATLKHFPGHGNTDTDTHVAFASVPGDWASLWRTELAPYRTALAADPGVVMTTHLWARALDDDPTPATFSRRALTDVLRDSLGFDGLITTDAMNMGAVRGRYSARERAVLPLLAGADIVLNETSPRRAIRYVVEAVENGTLPRARVDESARRMLLAKARMGLHQAEPPSRERLARMLSEVRGRRFAQALSRASVTVVRDGALLPLRPSQNVALVQLANFNAGTPMTRLERDLAPDARARVTRGGGGTRSAVAAARGADVVVVAMHLRVLQGRPPRLSSAQQAAVDAIEATGKPVVAVVLGNPYAAALLPEAPALVVAFDETTRTASAVADVLAGRHTATGRLPVAVPGVEG